MKPIQFQDANAVMKGTEDGEVLDLPVKIVGLNEVGEMCHYMAPQAVTVIVQSMWKPNEDEVNRLKAGAAVQISIHTSTGSIPPMSVTASNIFPETMIN